MQRYILAGDCSTGFMNLQTGNCAFSPRNPEACSVPGANIQVFRGDAFSPATLRETMKGVEVAWHLWVPVDTMQKKTAKAPAILPRWPAVSKGQSEHLISREETGRVGFYSATHIRGRYWLLQYDIRKNDSLNRNSIGS